MGFGIQDTWIFWEPRTAMPVSTDQLILPVVLSLSLIQPMCWLLAQDARLDALHALVQTRLQALRGRGPALTRLGALAALAGKGEEKRQRENLHDLLGGPGTDCQLEREEERQRELARPLGGLDTDCRLERA